MIPFTTDLDATSYVLPTEEASGLPHHLYQLFTWYVIVATTGAPIDVPAAIANQLESALHHIRTAGVDAKLAALPGMITIPKARRLAAQTA